MSSLDSIKSLCWTIVILNNFSRHRKSIFKRTLLPVSHLILTRPGKCYQRFIWVEHEHVRTYFNENIVPTWNLFLTIVRNPKCVVDEPLILHWCGVLLEVLLEGNFFHCLSHTWARAGGANGPLRLATPNPVALSSPGTSGGHHFLLVLIQVVWLLFRYTRSQIIVSFFFFFPHSTCFFSLLLYLFIFSFTKHTAAWHWAQCQVL